MMTLTRSHAFKALASSAFVAFCFIFVSHAALAAQEAPTTRTSPVAVEVPTSFADAGAASEESLAVLAVCAESAMAAELESVPCVVNEDGTVDCWGEGWGLAQEIVECVVGLVPLMTAAQAVWNAVSAIYDAMEAGLDPIEAAKAVLSSVLGGVFCVSVLSAIDALLTCLSG